MQDQDTISCKIFVLERSKDGCPRLCCRSYCGFRIGFEEFQIRKISVIREVSKVWVRSLPVTDSSSRRQAFMAFYKLVIKLNHESLLRYTSESSPLFPSWWKRHWSLPEFFVKHRATFVSKHIFQSKAPSSSAREQCHLSTCPKSIHCIQQGAPYT